MNTIEQIYLTETSLGRFLEERLDTKILHGCQVPTIVNKFRPDYRSEKFKLIIEFDGNQHYCMANYVVKDKIRDKIFSDAGYKIIRISYFVQLTTAVIIHLFGDFVSDISDFKNFPHGFIAESAVLPADYCELGIQRFISDLDKFRYIQNDIIISLKHNIERLKDINLVLPPSLHSLIK